MPLHCFKLCQVHYAPVWHFLKEGEWKSCSPDIWCWFQWRKWEGGFTEEKRMFLATFSNICLDLLFSRRCTTERSDGGPCRTSRLLPIPWLPPTSQWVIECTWEGTSVFLKKKPKPHFPLNFKTLQGLPSFLHLSPPKWNLTLCL